jgi:hypothetical protein
MGVYICEEIMTSSMVRRREKISISLAPAVIRVGPTLDFAPNAQGSAMVERRLISATQVARQPTSRVFSRTAKEREMENLIARVATAADLSPDVARKAVALIGDFIQREAPEEAVKDLFKKAPAFPAIIASSSQTGGEGMGAGLKGLMGVSSGAMGGGGLMALGSELLSLGLDMEQIQTIGKEVFGYARETAGDEVVGEISAAIPGLSQFI